MIPRKRPKRGPASVPPRRPLPSRLGAPTFLRTGHLSSRRSPRCRSETWPTPPPPRATPERGRRAGSPGASDRRARSPTRQRGRRALGHAAGRASRRQSTRGGSVWAQPAPAQEGFPPPRPISPRLYVASPLLFFLRHQMSPPPRPALAKDRDRARERERERDCAQRTLHIVSVLLKTF